MNHLTAAIGRPVSLAAPLLALLCGGSVSTGADPKSDAGAQGSIPFPHPIITEVLFDVPPGAAGDATGDGAREANGDEFVELFNPHSKPINLKGYRVVNRLAAGDKSASRGFAFTFPACEVPPGGLVVLFNGQDSTVAGPVGTAAAAPPAVNPNFGGAQVFVAKSGKSKPTGFKNEADCAVLESPDGKPVDVVVWGNPDPPAPEGALRSQNVKARPKGSVQRVSADATLQPHLSIDSKPFSPGVMPAFGGGAKPPEKPAQKPGEKPGKGEDPGR
jgi:hypothetical protein